MFILARAPTGRSLIYMLLSLLCLTEFTTRDGAAGGLASLVGGSSGGGGVGVMAALIPGIDKDESYDFHSMPISLETDLGMHLHPTDAALLASEGAFTHDASSDRAIYLLRSNVAQWSFVEQNLLSEPSFTKVPSTVSLALAFMRVACLWLAITVLVPCLILISIPTLHPHSFTCSLPHYRPLYWRYPRCTCLLSTWPRHWKC